MKPKRPNIQPERRLYTNLPLDPTSRPDAKPDLLQIWAQQRRLREREVLLEQEYERTKARLRELKIKMKHNSGLLPDAADLETSFYEDFLEHLAGLRLWLVKSLKRASLKADILYLKLRQGLRIPVKRRQSFWPEKAALAITITAVAGWGIMGQKSTEPAPVAAAAVQGQSAPAETLPLNQTPGFSILKPDGKDISAFGGYARVSPASSEPVYAFTDQISGAKIKVSQQQLPGKFKNDSSEITKLAAGFNADRSISVDGAEVYIGQSVKGPQSVIFQKNSLLILISSDRTVNDTAWAGYIAKLKP